MSDKLLQQIGFVYRAGAVTRFHGVKTLNTQTIGDHSWHVVMLLYLLYGQSEPGVSFELMMAALTHDAAEHKLGDLPSPAKRGLDEHLDLEAGTFRAKWDQMEQVVLAEQELNYLHLLSEEQKRQLEFVDAAEGAMFCLTEISMGSRLIHVQQALLNYLNYMADLIPGTNLEEVPLEPAADEPAYIKNERALFDYINNTAKVVLNG